MIPFYRDLVFHHRCECVSSSSIRFLTAIRFNYYWSCLKSDFSECWCIEGLFKLSPFRLSRIDFNLDVCVGEGQCRKYPTIYFYVDRSAIAIQCRLDVFLSYIVSRKRLSVIQIDIFQNSLLD